METSSIENLKFPVGKFSAPESYTPQFYKAAFEIIKNFPTNLKAEVTHLNTEQLDTAYRPDGWTIRQVVHHCADSHMNGFIRLKLTLSEDKPTIKPYNQDAFAQLADSKHMAIEPSLQIIEGLHARWYEVLEHLKADDFEKIYIHPEYMKEYSIKEFIALYAWHCQTHLGHITSLKKRMGWK